MYNKLYGDKTMDYLLSNIMYKQISPNGKWFCRSDRYYFRISNNLNNESR